MNQVDLKEPAKVDAGQFNFIKITLIKDQKALIKLDVDVSTTVGQIREYASLGNWIRFRVNDGILPEKDEKIPATNFLDEANVLYVFEYVCFYLYPMYEKFGEGLFINGLGSLMQAREEFRIPQKLHFVLNHKYISIQEEQNFQVTQLRQNQDIYLINHNMIEELGLKVAYITVPPEISTMKDFQGQVQVEQKIQQLQDIIQIENIQVLVTIIYRKTELQKLMINPHQITLLQLREQVIGASNKRFLYYQLVLLDADEQQPVSTYLDTLNYLYLYDFTNMVIFPDNAIFKSGCLNYGVDIQISDLRRQHSIPKEYLFLYRGDYIQQMNESFFLIRHIRQDQDIYLLNIAYTPNYKEAQSPEPKDEQDIEIIIDDQFLQVTRLHQDILVQDVRHFIMINIPYQFTINTGNFNRKVLPLADERKTYMKTLLVGQDSLILKSIKQPQPVKIEVRCNNVLQINSRNYNPFTSLFDLRRMWNIEKYRKFLFQQRILFTGDEIRAVYQFLDERGVLECFDFVNFYIQPEAIPYKNRLLQVGPGESLLNLREYNQIPDDYVFILNKCYVPQEVEDKIKVKQLRIRQEVQLVKIENILALGLGRLLPHQFDDISTLPDCYQPIQQQKKD